MQISYKEQHFVRILVKDDEMPLQAAKKVIKEFFEEHHGEVIDYGDLMDALDLPLYLIVEACNELEKEGKIASVD